MARLVEELLDASRISGGKVRLRLERLDLTALVRQTADDHRGGLEALGLALHVEAPARPVWVSGDAVRLTQVLGNLLQNAAKFSDRGGRVEVRLTEEGGRAVVAVRDAGVGMEPALLPRLFEMFAQADHSLERSKGGLGLDLALVKGLVNLHGGDVGAASDGLGKGAEFHFWLPTRGEGRRQARRRPRRRRKPGNACWSSRTIGTRRRVYVYSYLLSGMKWRRRFRGRRGWKRRGGCGRTWCCATWACRACRVSRWPGRMRADPATASARLIAVSGYSHDDDRRKAREAGFDGALVKPVEPATFERVLAGEPLSWDGAGG